MSKTANNPFRHPADPPETLPSFDDVAGTSASAGGSNPSQARSVFASPPPAGSSPPSSYAPPPGPPPSLPPSQSPPGLDEFGGPGGLDEELPPAYTPSVDWNESSVERGPRRPFQQPPPPPQANPRWQPQSQSAAQSPYAPSPQQQGGWSSYPGQGQPPPQHPQQQYGPPPLRHNSSVSSGYGGGGSGADYYNSGRYGGGGGYGGRSPGGMGYSTSQRGSRKSGGLIGALLDTVKDVVDHTVQSHNQAMDAQKRAIQASYTSCYAPSVPASTPDPYGGGGHPAYAPPAPAPPPQSGRQSREGPGADMDNGEDRRPTHVPVPGRILLKDDKIIVYPNNQYICVKCKNTGYLNYDPSDPCNKCWQKYSKPYRGAITYTPWNSEMSNKGSKLQRPLPRSVQTHVSTSSAPHSRSSSHGQYRGDPYASAYAQPSGPPPPPPHHQSYGGSGHGGGSGQAYYARNTSQGVGLYAPSPGAISVAPGDPRLGGMICPKCNGRGVVPVLFDENPCPVCTGVGRIY